MSASQASALTAVAFRLAAALDRYEEDVDLLMQRQLDPQLYHALGEHMDQIRQFAGSLPVLSVAWVEVMIRHFELTQSLWRQHAGMATAAEVERIRADQKLATRRLREQCLRLVAEPDRLPTTN